MFAGLDVESVLVEHAPGSSEFPKVLGKRDGNVLAADTDTALLRRYSESTGKAMASNNKPDGPGALKAD